LDAFFKLSERGTTVKTEVLAGATTFITLAYVIFVNPAISTADSNTPTIANRGAF